MRNYSEPCLRNISDRILILGFEEWDIFVVVGLGIFMQAIGASAGLTWLMVAGLGIFLYFFKKGKPDAFWEHFFKWFTGAKKFTAYPQAIFKKIKGRNIDLKLTSLQEILPYSHIEDDFLVFSDESISACYEITAPVIENYSKEELVMYANKIETILNNVSESSTCQIFFTLDSNYSKEIDEHKQAKNNHPLMAQIHNQRISYLSSWMENKDLRRKRCFFFVNYTGKEFSKKVNPFASFKKVYQIREEEVTKKKQEARFQLQSLEGGFEGAGFGIRRLKEYEIMKIIYKYLNPDRIKQGFACPLPKKRERFVKQVCCSDFSVDEIKGEYIHYGGFYHKYISLKVLPEETFVAMLEWIANISFIEFDIIVNFQAPAKEWGRKKILNLRRREYGNLRGMFGILNRESENKIRQYDSLIDDIQQRDQKMFRMQLVVHVYAATPEELKRKSAEVIRVFNSLNGAEVHDERWGAVLPIFIGTLPGWTKESSRWNLLKTVHLVDFLPFFSEFKGSGRAECIFGNTSGGLATFDPFSDDLEAFNIIVIGSSGSGKSFTISQVINQYSKNDPVEIFIDVGGSYRRQVLLKDGEYINLGLQEKFTINLFDLGKGKQLKDFNDEEQVEILNKKAKTIEQMIGGLLRFGADDQIVGDYIFRTLELMYLEIAFPVLSDFYRTLGKVAQSNINFQRFYERVAGLLGIWLKGGKYGSFTDGQSTIVLDKNVICFDLKGLDTYPELQSVMFIIVTNFVWGKIMQEKQRRKFVIFDECWKLLNSPEAAQFIAECYRTFRKYGSSAISVTQSLNDFLGGKLEHAILGNTQTRFILRQNSQQAIKQIVEYFNFNEQEENLINNLRIRKGEFSQVFFSQTKQLRKISGVFTIIPTPLEYWLATTDAEDVRFFEQIRNKDKTQHLWQSLLDCAKEYPAGVAYSRQQSA